MRALILLFLAALAAPALAAGARPRLLVLTDIGGDPDDQQSLIRLMVYSNEFAIEGLIATGAGTPGRPKEAVVQPDLIRQIVNAYGEVRPNLMRHAEGWPEPAALLALVRTGNAQRGREFIGATHDAPGSRLIIERVDAGDPDAPLNITIWGGQTDFAQALWRVRKDRGSEKLTDFIRRFRVYDINDQDGLADWMRAEFPGMFYILASCEPGRDKREGTYRGMYLTGDESLTSRAWVDSHIRNKGPLGALYPTLTWTEPNPHGCLKEGDTPSWFYFLPAGGNVISDPTRPGWGGRFVKQSDGWFRDFPFRRDADPRLEVSRWRPQFQADFARRMQWCVPRNTGVPPANRHPILTRSKRRAPVIRRLE